MGQAVQEADKRSAAPGDWLASVCPLGQVSLLLCLSAGADHCSAPSEYTSTPVLTEEELDQRLEVTWDDKGHLGSVCCVPDPVLGAL